MSQLQRPYGPTASTAVTPGSSRRVLYVGDDPVARKGIALKLQAEGFELLQLEAQRSLEAVIRTLLPAMVVVEMRPPAAHAIEQCRIVRSCTDVPLIVLAWNPTEIDLVLSFELGADDFLVHPIRAREFVARTRRAFNRHLQPAVSAREDVPLRVGDLVIDDARREAFCNGGALTLPLKEFNLLVLLAMNEGRALTRAHMMREVWGTDHVGSTDTLDVHVKRLRKKLELAHGTHTITTVRGYGYKLDQRGAAEETSG